MKSYQPLTPTEQRVLELCAGGATYGDIASTEGLTINEVLAAIGIVCMKLDVATEAEAIRCFTGEDLERALLTEHERRFGADIIAQSPAGAAPHSHTCRSGASRARDRAFDFPIRGAGHDIARPRSAHCRAFHRRADRNKQWRRHAVCNPSLPQRRDPRCRLARIRAADAALSSGAPGSGAAALLRP